MVFPKPEGRKKRCAIATPVAPKRFADPNDGNFARRRIVPGAAELAERRDRDRGKIWPDLITGPLSHGDEQAKTFLTQETPEA